MPLHLLGKKSWNVYNADNIARVRADEEAAKAREEAEEQRLQEIDSERRLAILRGEIPPSLSDSAPEQDIASTRRHRDRDTALGAGARERKKRKRSGEDDTDFELRIARERAGAGPPALPESKAPRKGNNTPITDAKGHINLFPEEASKAHLHSQKNPEAEHEAARKKREVEDQYRMRLASATGKGGTLGPWYANGDGLEEMVKRDAEAPGQDVWGNNDSRRIDRDAARIISDDPLAIMKRGAAKSRQVENERKAANEEREREMKRLRREERKHSRSRRHSRELEGFRQDGREDEPSRTRKSDGWDADTGNRRRHHAHHRDRHRSSHRSSRQHSDLKHRQE